MGCSHLLHGGASGDSLFGGDGNDFYFEDLEDVGGTLISDQSGSNDELTIYDPSNKELKFIRNDKSKDLFIDLNNDGIGQWGSGSEDVIILGFFSEGTDNPGAGFIETINDINGYDIISQVQPASGVELITTEIGIYWTLDKEKTGLRNIYANYVRGDIDSVSARKKLRNG